MRSEPALHTQRSDRARKMPAVLMAVLTLLGFSVAVAGPPTGLASYHVDDCDATVSDGGSIQAAIDAAQIGDTVCVQTGTYAESLAVDKADLTVAGPNDGVPGDGTRDAEATVTGQVVLGADGVTFDGFEVTPPPASANAEGEAVRVSSTPDGVTVQNNVVRDFTEDGLDDWLGVEGIVAFGGDASDAIEEVAVRDNKVHRIDGLAETGGAAGIMIQGNVDGATVEGNVVTEVGREDTAWGQAVVVTGTGNHDVAPRDVTIRANQLSDILANPDTPWFGVGIGLESDGASYVVEDNEIRDNELGIEVKAAADEIAVDGNVIAGNAELGASNVDEATLDATGNWWGSPLGPTHEDNDLGDTGLTGDEVSDGVAFDPWCLEPLCLTT